MSLEAVFAAHEQSQKKLSEEVIRHTRNADREVAKAVREAERAVNARKQAEHERDLVAADLERYRRVISVFAEDRQDGRDKPGRDSASSEHPRGIGEYAAKIALSPAPRTH